MMQSVQQFFVGNYFRIPVYQRDYAWGIEQVQDLVEDIGEAIQEESEHYLGTLVLANEAENSHEVVDGQQRISTVVLLMAALLEQLPENSDTRAANRLTFVMEDERLKLDFGINQEFVIQLLESPLENPGLEPDSAGQRNLATNFRYCREHAQDIKNGEGEAGIQTWIRAVCRLKVISFEAANTGSAIRLFQTVNDRGLPLSNMDKAKSLLVYYSNRYLEGDLDRLISDSFGRCFRAFDEIVEFVRDEDFRIDSISREGFSDNELLRYHYLAYYPPEDCSGVQNVCDYDGYMRTVFDSFLKGTLKNLNNSEDDDARQELRTFIDDYVRDLADFCEAFRDLVRLAAESPKVYKMLVVLGLSVRLYPFAIRMLQRGLLFERIPAVDASVVEYIEIADLRVYKTRGTDPGRDVGDLSHRSRFGQLEDLAEGLMEFVRKFASDGSFEANLGGEVYRNRGLVHLLLALEEMERGQAFTIDELTALRRLKMTREHILSQAPGFGFADMGFEDQEDYDICKNQLGNLTLLTQSENTTCSNRNPAEKLGSPVLYAQSRYRISRNLATKYANGSLSPNREMIRIRGEAIIDWAVTRWPLST